MPRIKPSKGQCAYCGTEIAKNSVSKHLSTCSERQSIIQQAERKKGASETLYHLRVQDTTAGADFWLDLEMRGAKSLKELDSYLRHIWLECCGHLSQFSIGGWGGEEIPMSRKADEVFKRNEELTHIYDFGTESVTMIKVVGVRKGKPATARPIALLARNLMPETICAECKKTATCLCMECMIEEGIWGVLCDKHAKKHPHENYGDPIPLVNSPRLGLCGYEGPAEPPY